MSEDNRRRGVSKGQWLEAALEALGHGGVAAIKIESLARSLGIAKSGFYWHFANRDELLQQLLDYWLHEANEIISKNPEVHALEPRARLIRIAEMILDFELTSYELSMRKWASEEPRAARVVRRVNRLRLDFVGRAFSELGFEGHDHEMRTMLFVGYHSMEFPMFPEISRKRRRSMIEQRVDLLIRK